MNAPAGAGTLGIGDDGAFRIHFDRTLRHPVIKVWQAITDPELRNIWLENTRIDMHPGGTVVYDFGDEGKATGEVLSTRPPAEADPSAELTHTWKWEGVPTSVVRWHLEPTDDGFTRLQLTHSELIREPAADFAVGWHAMLDTAERYLDGESWDDVWGQYEELAAHYCS